MEKQESKRRFPTFPQPRRLRTITTYGIRILRARSQSAITDPASTLLSETRGAARNVPLYRQLSGWRLAKCVLRLTVVRLLNIWCIWSGAARSLVWHIGIQSSKETPHVILGPAPLLSPEGSILDQPGTRARAEGIRSLSAKYPWVDIVHLQIFLMGFDAGAQMYVQRPRIETDKQSESPS
jgi:hypothetical protein